MAVIPRSSPGRGTLAFAIAVTGSACWSSRRPRPLCSGAVSGSIPPRCWRNCAPNFLPEVNLMQALLNPPALPVFSCLTPEDVEPAVDRLLADYRAEVERLAGQSQPTWDSLAAPLEAMDARLNAAWAPISQLNAVMNSDAWRAAYNACIPKLSAFATEVGQNETLFRAWRALRDAPAFATLDAARRQAVENALRDFRLSGIGL